ncbi:MAG: AI-2E family transporter, partial [Bacteroidota bacterium]
MANISRYWVWLFATVFIALIGYYFSDIVTYIMLAWVLSMLGRPIMVFFLKRFRLGRFRIGLGLASMLTILTFYGLIFGVLYLFVPTIVAQARNLTNVDYAALGEKLRGPFFDLDSRLHQLGMLNQGESLATRIQELLSTYFKPTMLGDFVGAFVGAAGGILVTFSAVTFILFFFLKENNLFIKIIHAFVPNEMEGKVRHAVLESSGMLTRYFRGLMIQVSIFAALSTIFLLLFGNQNALLIGAFGGIFNIIPYVGPILGVIFGCFITISSHLDLDFALLLPMLLKVAVAIFTVQFIDNSVLGPMIFSKSVQAHPLEIFIVTLVAAKLGGVVGMVMGIPVYTILRVIARTFFS